MQSKQWMGDERGKPSLCYPIEQKRKDHGTWETMEQNPLEPMEKAQANQPHAYLADDTLTLPVLPCPADPTAAGNVNEHGKLCCAQPGGYVPAGVLQADSTLVRHTRPPNIQQQLLPQLSNRGQAS